ncbi:hypothetical protein [Streptomyces sp. NPDC015345]|uniref:hypothetical protein n=1 Tax=Streptomyces sp. NPDC015345 TaxID=3364953 RepID=UPI0036FDEABC
MEALVEILATRSPRTSPEREVDRFHRLWVDAARSVIASGLIESAHEGGADAATKAAHWIVVVDIAGFSGASDWAQAGLHQRLYTYVEEALDFAGLRGAAQIADRGDSLFILHPVEQATLGALLGFLLHVQRLAADQPLDEARMIMRLAVSQGAVTVSPNEGWYGADLNTAVRLLDTLRQAVHDPTVCIAVAMAEQVYDGLRILEPHGFRPDFRRAHAATKVGNIPVWIYTAESV